MEKSYRTNNIVFAVLIILTLLTWFMGQQEMSLKLSFAILLTTAVIKVQLIGDFFMHLISVGSFWRWVISLWIIFTGGLITIAFLF